MATDRLVNLMNGPTNQTGLLFLVVHLNFYFYKVYGRYLWILIKMQIDNGFHPFGVHTYSLFVQLRQGAAAHGGVKTDDEFQCSSPAWLQSSVSRFCNMNLVVWLNCSYCSCYRSYISCCCCCCCCCRYYSRPTFKWFLPANLMAMFVGKLVKCNVTWKI